MKHTKRIPTIYILLMATALYSGCSGSSGSPDPWSLWKTLPDEKIVFMSKADSSAGDLYLLDKNGDILRLTNTPARQENNPALSPDRMKVVYNAGDEDNYLTWEIYVLDLATMVETRLTTNDVIDAHADWAPGGTRIVFGSFRDESEPPGPTAGADLFVMDLTGTILARLTDSPDIEDNDPEWSPDGSMIVFKSTRDTGVLGKEQIYVMDIDADLNTSNTRRITTTTGWISDHDPSWNPDSSEVLFARYEGIKRWFDFDPVEWTDFVPWNIFSHDLSTVEEKITDNSLSGWGVALYSEDGSKILYGRTDWIVDSGNNLIGGNHRLILTNPDGTDQIQLIPDDRHTGSLEYFDW